MYNIAPFILGFVGCIIGLLICAPIMILSIWINIPFALPYFIIASTTVVGIIAGVVSEF